MSSRNCGHIITVGHRRRSYYSSANARLTRLHRCHRMRRSKRNTSLERGNSVSMDSSAQRTRTHGRYPAYDGGTGPNPSSNTLERPVLPTRRRSAGPSSVASRSASRSSVRRRRQATYRPRNGTSGVGSTTDRSRSSVSSPHPVHSSVVSMATSGGMAPSRRYLMWSSLVSKTYFGSKGRPFGHAVTTVRSGPSTISRGMCDPSPP